MARRLGIDHGEKRIGLALSDAGCVLASPYGVAHGEREFWGIVERLVREEDLGGFVVGLPLHMDGREGRRARRARFFARKLEARYGLPVELVDERQSSLLAEERLLAAGIYGRRRQDRIDAVAAQIILQDWIDRLASTRRPDERTSSAELAESPEASEPRASLGDPEA